MKKLLITALTGFLLSAGINAQEAVVSGGGYHSGQSRSISWTLGEIAIETLTSPEKTLTQGFQQPNLSVVWVDDPQNIDILVSAYPNPTTDILYIHVKKEVPENATFTLYDMKGNLLTSNNLTDSRHKLSFTTYKPGVYFVRLSFDSQYVKTFKILKQ